MFPGGSPEYYIKDFLLFLALVYCIRLMVREYKKIKDERKKKK